MVSHDRRGSYRLDVSIVPDETVLAGRGRMPRSLSAVIHDLSAAGARLSVLTTDLRTGQVLRIRFPLGAEEFKVAAEVKWVRSSRRGNGSYVGVQFKDVVAADRRRILGEITREQRRQTQGSVRR